MLDIIHRGNAYYLSDSVLREKSELADFQIKGNRIAQAVTNIVSAEHYPFVRSLPGARIMYWNDKVVMQITDKNFAMAGDVSIDFLVISNNAISSLQEVTKRMHCGRIIIDSSNSIYLADNLMKEAGKFHHPVYSVLHDGAFLTEL